MSAVTFDTLKLVDALEKVDIPRAQARAIVDVVRESHDGAEVATKGDLRELELRLRNEITDVRGDIALVRKDFDALRWIMGAVLGGIVAILVRSFF